ncbi:MAG: helix-turn-helix domain-containing protein [Candidatus Cybelea sp.]
MDDRRWVTTSSEFGALLRRYRIAAGLTQADLAERARISINGVGALERGYRRSPQRETIALLGDALALRDEQRAEFVAAAARSVSPRRIGGASGQRPERAAGNLPLALTSFIGRENELDEIARRVRQYRLVTITGPGGIGKTQMALRVLNALHKGPCVYFVSLAPLLDGSLVIAAIASAFGLQKMPNRPLIDTLVAYLKNMTVLLVLDNCEHMICDAAAVADELTSGCPNVRILATSREPLRVAGERIYQLSPLSLASAVSLFADRARAVDHQFALGEENEHVVARICRNLDGIPLAVELAAARVNLFSVKALAERLEDRFRILVGGARTALPRQQTMRAAIDWSYDLLSPQEKRLFEHLSVFAGSFTLATATAFYAHDEVVEEKVFDLLASLVVKSLVVADLDGAETRYRLLELFREYARERLAARGEEEAVLHRYAVVQAAFARDAFEEWDRGPSLEWISRLEPEVSNLRAVLRWSVDEANDCELGARLVADTSVIFLRLGLLDEAVARCEHVLQAGLPLTSSVEARLRYGLSMLYSNIGKNSNVLEQAQIAASLYRAASDSRGLARALSQVASRYAILLQFDRAQRYAEEALWLARASEDRRLLADTLRRCALSFGAEGGDRVRALYSESVALFRALGRDDETARALEWWGKWEEDEVGNFQEAADHFLEAMKLDTRRETVIYRLTDVAGCYLAVGDYRRAESFAHEGLAAAANARHPVMISLATSYLAIVASTRDAASAARLIGYAEAGLRAVNWQRAAYEKAMVDRLYGCLRKKLPEAELERLLAEGASWSEDQAVSQAFLLGSLSDVLPTTS